ncbi:MAG: hypothetical protein LBR42_04420 [Candidatus Methanoplasma sp.]|jgi:hypothetical protein|nr:hypothetical protein [Candidatus Methanoplasma sp.]
MTEEQAIRLVKKLCETENVPADGWIKWSFNRPGPKVLRREDEEGRTHTAYIRKDATVVLINDTPGKKWEVITEQPVFSIMTPEEVFA